MGGGRKPTPKQRKFAESYVEIGNACEAYPLAYDTKNMKLATVRREAMRALSNPIIATYIRELQSAHRQRHDVTVDGLVDELEEARFFAMVFGHIGAAVTATMGKAKLHGLITDNIKLNGLEALKRKTDEELVESIRELAAEITGYTAAAERKPRGA